jgi:hypothetical protein
MELPFRAAGKEHQTAGDVERMHPFPGMKVQARNSQTTVATTHKDLQMDANMAAWNIKRAIMSMRDAQTLSESVLEWRLLPWKLLRSRSGLRLSILGPMYVGVPESLTFSAQKAALLHCCALLARLNAQP